MIRYRVAALCLILAPMVLCAGQKKKQNKSGMVNSGDLFSLTPSQQINRDISEMLAAWQLGDTAKLRKYYAPDVIVVSGFDQPPIAGWIDFLAAYEKQHRRVRSGQMIRRNTYVQVDGDVGWACYQWEFGGLVDGRPKHWRGHTTLIFERRTGNWLIVLNHTSLDAVPRRPSVGHVSSQGTGKQSPGRR